MNKLIYIALASILFSGCSSSAINSLTKTTLTNLINKDSKTSVPVLHGNALKGAISTPSTIAPAMLNPATIGVTAIAGAMDEREQQKNREYFEKLKNTNMEQLMLNKYNQEHGTNYSSLEELKKDIQNQ